MLSGSNVATRIPITGLKYKTRVYKQRARKARQCLNQASICLIIVYGSTLQCWFELLQHCPFGSHSDGDELWYICYHSHVQVALRSTVESVLQWSWRATKKESYFYNPVGSICCNRSEYDKLTVQNLHKWWYRTPKEVLNQQGIEPHPGPNFGSTEDRPRLFHIVFGTSRDCSVTWETPFVPRRI